MDKKYDVFISYRRDGGDDCAMWLKTKLERDGFHAYLDVDAFDPGDYTEQIDNALKQSHSVIVLLTNHCLDRCRNEDDAVRKEIANSLSWNKNVIPILKRGFTFPEKLPDDIDSLRYQSGLPLENYYRDAFYALLLKALHSPSTEKPAAPDIKKPAFSLSLQKWTENNLRGTYGGFLHSHLSTDLRFVALIDLLTRRLEICEIETQRVIASLEPLKHPFTQYQLYFAADNRYLYLIRENHVVTFDILRNAYISAKETTLPFAAKRRWDKAYAGKEGDVLFLDHDGDILHTAVHLTGSSAKAYSLQKYAYGRAIASAPVAGRDAVILAHPGGRLSALHAQSGKLHILDSAQTVEECLQSGKRFGDAFGRENLYWALTGSNGMTAYTDFFRTQDGEHLHRVFHGKSEIFFTRDDTAVWYDAQSGQLTEEDFLQQKNRLIADCNFFAGQEAFFGRKPVLGAYSYENDAFVFVAVPDDIAHLRFVMLDRQRNILSVSEDYPCPAHARQIDLRVQGTHLAFTCHCDDGKNPHTVLFTARIRENN